MIHRILNFVPIKIIASVLVIILAVLFLTAFLNPSSWIVAAICFVVAAGLLALAAGHFDWRAKENVALFSKEVTELTVNLSEKTYPATNETEPFFDALTQTKRVLDKKSRTRQELLEIVNSVASHMEIAKLLLDLLPKLNDATRSCCSAFYSINPSTNKLEIKHSVGFSKNVYSEFDMNLGEGIIGQAAAKREITYYRDIPDDTVFFIRTFIGKIKPRSLMVVPVMSQDSPAGALVCASIYDYEQDDKDMIELIRHYVGVAVSNSANFERTKRLTSELTFQNKLIQDQHEQMKTRLDEKTLWLNSLLRLAGSESACAVDAKGAVVIWGEKAEQTFGISARVASGKSFAKLCEDAGWSSVSNAMEEALRTGECAKRLARRASGDNPPGELEMNMQCVYDSQNAPLGILVSILFF